MTMTSTHVRIVPSGSRPAERAAAQPGFADRAIGLAAIAILTSVAGAGSAAAVAALIVAAFTGSWAAAGQVLALGIAFLAVTVPTTAIWLLGAVGTQRTIRRLAATSENRDRAAFAELHALLARE